MSRKVSVAWLQNGVSYAPLALNVATTLDSEKLRKDLTMREGPNGLEVSGFDPNTKQQVTVIILWPNVKMYQVVSETVPSKK